MNTQATTRPVSQIAAIAAHLNAGHTLTASEALTNFGSFRLAAAIKRLRDRGMPIRTTEKVNPATGVRYASYSLLPPFEVRCRVRVASLEASKKHNLLHPSGGLLGHIFEKGDVGRVVAVSDRSVFVQFAKVDGKFRCGDGQWWVRKEDLELRGEEE